MAHSKSNKKAIRVAERKRLRNKSVRSTVKTYTAKADKLISSKDKDSAKEATVKAISSLDKATQKGVIHRNNAARKKSHLMKKLNQLEKA